MRGKKIKLLPKPQEAPKSSRAAKVREQIKKGQDWVVISEILQRKF